MNHIDKKIVAYVEAQLRRIFKWTSAYKECKKRAHLVGELYTCEGCECVINKKGLEDVADDALYEGKPIFSEQLHVDHINPVKPLQPDRDSTEWARGVVLRALPSEHALMYLCQSCHYLKTQIENAERRENKAKLKLKVEAMSEFNNALEELSK